MSQTYVSAIHILRAVHLFQQNAIIAAEHLPPAQQLRQLGKVRRHAAGPRPWVKRSPKAIRRGSFLADLFSTGEELERRANGHDLNGTDADLAKDVRQPLVI
jgi:hypothetical protein